MAREAGAARGVAPSPNLRRSPTLGAYRDGVWKRASINALRGLHPRIRDRFDLTLECIRLHYAGEPNALKEALDFHAEFFALFGSFAGYVDHFLLNDLVTPNYQSIKFHKPFESFKGDALPASSVAEYRE